MTYDDIGLRIPDILLPGTRVPPQHWAVIACDQYSSQPDYWQTVAATCADQPSTLNMIIPEAYLGENDGRRINAIHQTMETYLREGLLTSESDSLVTCERELSDGRQRKGVMVALDLECYSYQPGAQTLIRATEGTIVERLPARLKVRENAALELPHIMVLIDDPAQTVIEPLFAARREPLYDTALMTGAGRITGHKVTDPAAIGAFVAGLQTLADPATFRAKYGAGTDRQPLLYAMGDGNHSFATAKAQWENLKKLRSASELADHPARYALVELVNLYDPSLQFEPIHRVVFDIAPETFIDAFCRFYAAEGGCVVSGDAPETDGHRIGFCWAGGRGELLVKKPQAQLATATLQQFIDAYLSDHRDSRVDYIHGTDTVTSLAAKPGNIGFTLPAIDKHQLFKTVIFDGALPRKTFSMGAAQDKRFYFECRRIQPTPTVAA